MKIAIVNPTLFYKKVMLLTAATIVLVPLIHFKLHFPAFLYLGALLVLHMYILYVYFNGVAWRNFLVHKKELALRLVAIAFFIYLLTVLSFVGSTATILVNLLAAFTLHVLILLFMMASRSVTEKVPRL